MQDTTLVDAGRSWPIDDINQLPGVLIEIKLQLPFLINDELGCRKQNARVLALVGRVQVEFARRQVEGHGLAVRPSFAKSNLTIGDKANLPARRGWNLSDVGAVVAESPRDLDMSHRSHSLECCNQPLVLTFLEGLDQDLLVRRRREIINVQRDANIRPELGARTHGCGFNRLRSRPTGEAATISTAIISKAPRARVRFPGAAFFSCRISLLLS